MQQVKLWAFVLVIIVVFADVHLRLQLQSGCWQMCMFILWHHRLLLLMYSIILVHCYAHNTILISADAFWCCHV